MSDKNKPLVTVIIPVYNNAEYIQHTLESVYDQTYKNHEIIVIDDGSSDESPKILAEQGRRIKLLTQKNEGAAVARNRGLERASGEFIAFLDGDDLWVEDNLERKIRILQHQPSVVGVFSNFSIFGDNILHEDGIFYLYPLFKRIKKSIAEIFQFQQGDTNFEKYYFGNIFDSLFWGNFILTSTCVFRKQEILSLGNFKSKLITQQDYDYFLRIAQKFPLAYLDKICTHYRRHPKQLTDRSNIERIFRTVISILDLYRDFFKERGRLSEFNKRQAENYLNLAKVLTFTGRRHEARKIIRHNIMNSPTHLEYYINLLMTYFPLSFINFLRSVI